MEIKPATIGFVLALIVFIVALVLGVIGHMSWPVAGLFMLLAAARML